MAKIAALLNDVCKERDRLGAAPGLRVATPGGGRRLGRRGRALHVPPQRRVIRGAPRSLSRRAGRSGHVSLPRSGRSRAVDAGLAAARQRARVFRVRARARHGRSLSRVRAIPARRSSGSRSTPAFAAGRASARCAFRRCARSRRWSPRRVPSGPRRRTARRRSGRSSVSGSPPPPRATQPIRRARRAARSTRRRGVARVVAAHRERSRRTTEACRRLPAKRT